MFENPITIALNVVNSIRQSDPHQAIRLRNLLPALAAHFANAGLRAPQQELQMLVENSFKESVSLKTSFESPRLPSHIAHYKRIAAKLRRTQQSPRSMEDFVKAGNYAEFSRRFIHKEPTETVCMEMAALGAQNGHIHMARHFLDHCKSKEAVTLQILKSATQYRQYHVLDYFSEYTNAPDLSEFIKSVHDKLSYETFKKISRAYGQSNNALPEEIIGLEQWPDFHLRLRPYLKIREMLVDESPNLRERNGIAFFATAIFQSPDRMLGYLDKWGVKSDYPIKKAMEKMDPPALNNIDWSSWGDALLKFGPEVSYYMQFADRILTPAKSTDGSISLRLTRSAVWQEGFSDKYEQPELAKLCFDHEQPHWIYRQALNVWQEKTDTDPVQPKGIPYIDMDCSDLGLEEYRFQKLSYDDYRILMLGLFTGCCEKTGDHFEETIQHALSTRESGFYVLMKDNEIKAHTWVWRGNRGELILDGFESLDPNLNDVVLSDLTDMVGTELKKPEHYPYRITNILLGTSNAKFSPQDDFGPMAKEVPRFLMEWYFTDRPSQWYVGECFPLPEMPKSKPEFDI